MKDITIVINARVQSTRVPKKIIRPFADTTLLDLALQKLEKINCEHKFLAACEPEIMDIYSKYDDSIGILPRTKESVLPNKHKVDFRIAFKHYELVKTPYILSMNACFPFSSTQTIDEAIAFFITNKSKTLTSVKKTTNIFFDKNLKPINLIHPYNVSSQWNDPVFEMAHMFHIFDKDVFMSTGIFWDYSPNNPDFFEIDNRESYDIDELFQFEMGEALYKGGWR